MHNYNYPLRKLRNQQYLPLGGIGTGCIGIYPSGEIKDFDIFGNCCEVNNGSAYFVIKCESDDGKTLEKKLLRDCLSGFSGGEFLTSFPYAELDFSDSDFPANAKLTAYNPFIPFNDIDSGIPAALFEADVENITDDVLLFTVQGVISSPFRESECCFTDTKNPQIKCVKISEGSEVYENGPIPQMCMGVFGDNIEYDADKSEDGGFCSVRISEKVRILPGTSKKIRFVISWYVPYRDDIWNSGENLPVKNYYTRYFESSVDCVRYCLTQWDNLYEKSSLTRELIFTSTLSDEILTAVSRGLCALKRPACQRYSDGFFTGFDSFDKHGPVGDAADSITWSCIPTLTHLFPALERAQLTDHFLYDIGSDGALAPRSYFPNGADESECTASLISVCCDILRVYRFFKLSNNTEFLSEIQKNLIAVIEHCNNQCNTEMSLCEVAYLLSVLKAGAELCLAVKDKKHGTGFRKLYESGFQALSDKISVYDFSENFADTISLLVLVWHCRMTGLEGIIEDGFAVELLSYVYDFTQKNGTCDTFLKGREYILASLLLWYGMNEKAINLLSEANVISKDFCGDTASVLMSSYSLLQSCCGLKIDRYGKYYRFCPDMSFAHKNVFRCFVCFDGFMGIVERGIDYIQLICVKGSILVRKVEAPDVPLKVKSAGIEIGFEKDGNGAILDNDCEITPEKDLFVIFRI